jgi:hypothetical protein
VVGKGSNQLVEFLERGFGMCQAFETTGCGI